MGGLQVADNRNMFTMKCPCDGKRCESEYSHLFSPAALCWSRAVPSQASWRRRLCWSQAALRESVSAWLSGWPLTPTNHSKVTRNHQSLYCISFKFKRLAGSGRVGLCCMSCIWYCESNVCITFLHIFWNKWPVVAFCLVYATMRNMAKKERLLECVKGLHKDTLDILQMDVTDQQSILDARDRVVEKRVDILGMFLYQGVLIKIAFCAC